MPLVKESEYAYNAPDRTPLSQVKPLPNRPGCVTVYAILLIFGALSNGLSACALLDSGAVPLGFFSLLLAAGGIAIAVGLWQQKDWARIGVVALMVISSLIVLWQLVALSDSGDLLVCIPGAAALAVPAFISYWFLKHGEYFE